MSDSTYGVGVIGTGWVAGAHVSNFQNIPGCEIVAACSRSQERARAFLDERGLKEAAAHDDVDAFLKTDGLDIVVVCTPHPQHPEQTIAAARAGKHVVIEKPVAMNREDLASMVAAVKEAGVFTSVCFELRWIGLFKNVKAIIEKGLIGTPFYGEASYFHGIGPWYAQYPWNKQKALGGDALLTAGCHALDGLIWLMGSDVTEVQAMSNQSQSNALDYEYDTNVVAIMRFANGAIGKVATSIECRQPYHFPLVIQGERGTVKDDRLASLDLPGLDGWAHLPTALPDSGNVDDHPYLGQLTEFVDGLRKGERVHNDLAGTAHVHEVMYAIQEAVQSRGTVAIPRTPGLG